MHPVLLQITLFSHELLIGSYGVITVIALSAGIILFIISGKLRKIEFYDSLNYALLISASAMLGASISGFLLFLPERISSGFLNYPHVMVSWGGISGGLVSAILISHFWKIDFLNLGDISGPAFLTGIGIGRTGCFFGGCCYGIHSDFFPSVVFTHPLAPASMAVQPLLPVQLISASILIAGGMFFFIMLARVKTGGIVFTSVLLYYSVFRFVIEFFRADPRKFLSGYSDAQVFSLFLFSAGLFLLFHILKMKYFNR